MYEAYWNVERKPFDNSGHADFYYPSDSHQGALLKLQYAVENRRGAAVISGVAGLGKSMLVRGLYDKLPEEYCPKVQIVFPQMPPEQLLAYLADELDGCQPNETNRTADVSIRRIQNALSRQANAGKHVIITVDEAHLLRDMGTLETMRLLLNLEVDHQPALTLILIGQLALLSNLDRMPGLEERLAVKCVLAPFSEEETASYVTHRLSVAGTDSTIFDQSALDAIHTLSLGIPRRINRLCDLALLVGFAEDREFITEEHIESVSDELVTVSVA